MQNMPCEVRAYRRFSILRLQFLQRKHVAQNAWSPVRIARSSILFPQALQLYVQLLQIREPSPRRRRFASESRSVPQVLHRKQFKCHRLPAAELLAGLDLDVGGAMRKLNMERPSKPARQRYSAKNARDLNARTETLEKMTVVWGYDSETYQAQRLCPLQEFLHILCKEKPLHLRRRSPLGSPF